MYEISIKEDRLKVISNEQENEKKKDIIVKFDIGKVSEYIEAESNIRISVNPIYIDLFNKKVYKVKYGEILKIKNKQNNKTLFMIVNTESSPSFIKIN